MKSIHVVVYSFFALLVGCAPLPQVKPTHSTSATAAEVSLAEAAASVSHSLNDLNQIKRASTPRAKRLVSLGRYTLPGRASIDWAGPIEPVLKQIATITHYRLRVLGTKPSVPVIVNLTATDELISDIVRNLDFQAASRANIRVYHRGGLRIIELRYAKT